MIISVEAIKKPRTSRKCDACCKCIVGSAIRMYGAADRGDRPYRIHVCPSCVGTGDSKSDRAKIDAAIRSLKSSH